MKALNQISLIESYFEKWIFAAWLFNELCINDIPIITPRMEK